MRRTVLIVDDHEAFRLASHALLEAEGYEVVGEAVNGDHALDLVQRLHPDVVLLDIQLPDFDGFTVADRIAAQGNVPDIVLISSRDAETYGPRVQESAARGFLNKADLSGAALADLLAG